MAQSIAAKFNLKPGSSILSFNEPAGYRKQFQPLPAGVEWVEKAAESTQIHWFVKDQASLKKDLSKVLPQLHPGALLWVFYPKGSSGIQTDLTRDKGWEALTIGKTALRQINLVSFDDTWSAFGFRKEAKDGKPANKVKQSNDELSKWIDPVKKLVRIPDDLKKAFKANPPAEKIYGSLAYSHRKEYVEWIVSAKKEETRSRRIEETLTRLLKGWKNPSNH